MEQTEQKVFRTRRRSLALGEKTHLVGILNLTPDSFSDGGDFDEYDKAEAQFEKMVSEGAAIIDIGGESTRPNHTAVSTDEEINRVLPFLERIRSKTDCLISIDTSKSEVAQRCLEAGADIINDIWGGQGDPKMLSVIADYDASCILMHNADSACAGQANLMQRVEAFLRESIDGAVRAGIHKAGIVVDPGLGFGKNFSDNWKILRELKRLKRLGMPILLGASRKSMIAQLLDIEDPKERLYGTLATTAWASMQAIDFVRVHDVLANSHCTQVIDYCTHHEAN